MALVKLPYYFIQRVQEVLRPAETLSIQIWNLQTNGQDRALANLSSAVLMILVLAFSIGANVWSRHISKKQAGLEK